MDIHTQFCPNAVNPQLQRKMTVANVTLPIRFNRTVMLSMLTAKSMLLAVGLLVRQVPLTPFGVQPFLFFCVKRTKAAEPPTTVQLTVIV